MLPPLLAGLGLGFSLIVAIGAQNLFVLRQGIRREHVFLVAAICAVSDAILIFLGVSGIGLVLLAVPWLDGCRALGGSDLPRRLRASGGRRAWKPSGAALDCRRRRWRLRPAAPRGADTTTTTARTRLLPVVLTCLALTWLNPHVYLDTVFLLGTVANTHGDERWVFAAGAMGASFVWFFGLAFGARYLGRWLSTPRAWRILDAIIAVVMIAIGVGLVLPH